MERYTTDHAWVRLEPDGRAVRVGLSDFAQGELGDIAWIELPPVGSHFVRGETACAIESLKSAGEVYAPVSGTVVSVNPALADEAGRRAINRDPLGEGWLFALRPDNPADLDALMSAEDYGRWISVRS
jgi:glycine cleavage system H protein